VDVDAALARLGLDRTSEIDQVKRSFRRLAHDHHPDRGGDSAAFAELSLAYRVLLEHHEPRPASPRVAQGRPSRAPVHVPAALDEGELTVPQPLDDAALADLRTGPGGAGALRVKVDTALLARLLVTVGDRAATAAGTPSELRTLTLLSRAPAARLNALAPLLAGGATSSLRIADPRDTIGGGMRPGDATRSGVALVLTARGRGARRAVESLDLDGSRSGPGWRRERGDTSVRLQTQVRPDSDPARTVRALVLSVDALLTALAWPLADWSIDPECLRA
jgi:hypothetical protein